MTGRRDDQEKEDRAVTVVDIHCHTFNADDLPVKGFVHAVGGTRVWLPKALAWALAKVTQGMASGADEIQYLDWLIARGPGLEAAGPSALDEVDDEADELLAELRAEDPGLADAAAREAADDPGSTADPGGGLEGLDDRAEELRRYLKWIALFGKSRLALTRALTELYPEVDLFVPLLVDFQGLDDQPRTTTSEQLRLQEQLSRLAIRGHQRAQLHPFVGFDPRRLGGLPLVQLAVAEYGCIGVKLYPPIGFLPIDNRTHPPEGMSMEDALGVDAALAALYDWCEDNQVPITAHGNPTIYAKRSYELNSHPDHWERVLTRWPELHLNLGHLGLGGGGWTRQIAEMMGRFRHLYGDFGNHELATLATTMELLTQLYADPATATLRQRLMFGTDWFMVATHHRYQAFLTEVRAAYAYHFPDDLAAFLGGNALAFLGFDDATNANNRRARERYRAQGVPVPSWLAS